MLLFLLEQAVNLVELKLQTFPLEQKRSNSTSILLSPAEQLHISPECAPDLGQNLHWNLQLSFPLRLALFWDSFLVSNDCGCPEHCPLVLQGTETMSFLFEFQPSFMALTLASSQAKSH